MSEAVEQARAWLMKPPTYEELLNAEWEALEDSVKLLVILRTAAYKRKYGR